jgi:DNA-binding CsgD family transcriptional regulator
VHSKLIATNEFVSILDPDHDAGLPLSIATARHMASLHLGMCDCCAAVFDAKGARIAASENFNEFFGISDDGDRTRLGRTGRDSWVAERSRLAHTTAITCRPSRIIEIARGCRAESFFTAVQDDRASEACVLQTTRRIVRCTAGERSYGVNQPPALATFHTWGPLDSLSRRQMEVLRLVTRGYGNDKIGAAIGRTKRAVEWHIRGLFAKLQCQDRVQLYVIGLRAGLDDISDEAWSHIIARRFPTASNLSTGF